MESLTHEKILSEVDPKYEAELLQNVKSKI